MLINRYKSAVIKIITLALIVVTVIGNAMPVPVSAMPYAVTDPPGTLDTSFDGDGLVTTSMSDFRDEGQAVAIQSDGKILVAGVANAHGNSDFALIRYNPNGSLDTSFDTDGKVTTDFAEHPDYANDLALQSDGKIIAAGFTVLSSEPYETDLALARYNSDGSLDTSFDLDGKVSTNLGGYYQSLYAIAVQADGKIVGVGYADAGIAVVRYNLDGSLDTTFDTDGIVITSIVGGMGTEYGTSLVIQPDGKILIGGRNGSGSDVDLTLVRYDSNGSLDMSFSGDGILVTDFAVGSNPQDNALVALQPDGKIILAGNNEYLLLARYNADGSPDTSFGTDGLVAISSFGPVYDIALQKNGKIVVVKDADTGLDFTILRFNPDGSADPTFGTDGVVRTDFGSNLDDFSTAVAIQLDGNIVVAGYRNTLSIYDAYVDIAVARYIGDDPHAIHRVKWDASGADDGTSWADAHTDLQSALAAASSGDEIWVSAGTYRPATGANRSATFQLKSGVAVYGGFAGTEVLRNQRDPEANVTILSGDIDNNDSQQPIVTDLHIATGNTTNSYHVVTGVTGATLDGFTITAGYANGSYPYNVGAGMYNSGASPTVANITFRGNLAISSGGGMRNDSSSPALTNVVFSDNSANSGGGGMYNYSSTPTLLNVTFSRNWTPSDGMGGGMQNSSSSPVLTNVIFSDNSSDYGGGVYNRQNSSPRLTNVTFHHNVGSVHGGGMDNAWASSPTLTNVTFSDNSSKYGGALRNFDNCNPTLTNVTFSGNTATNDGGAIENNSNSSPTMTNVTFSGNHADNRGGAIFNYSSSPILRNSILWGNGAPTGSQILNMSSTPSLNDSVVQDGCPAGSTCTNVIAGDPKLGLLGDYGGNTQTIPLQYGSSAIDVGNDATCAVTDQRGVSRPQGEHCDMGAYETAPHVPVTFTVTKTADTNDGICNSDCSLREAMIAAGDGDVIRFMISGTITLGSELSVIDDNLTMDGSGQFIIVDGAHSYRIFKVTTTGNLTINHLTLQNGNYSSPCLSGTPGAPSCGGGIYSDGILTVINSTFSGNSAQNGGGIAVYGGTAHIANSTFFNNSATGVGGGILNWTGTVSVSNSTFFGNSATSGGGIYNDISSLTLANNTFSGNSATQGAGLYNAGMSLTFTNNILADSASGSDCYNEDGAGEIATNINNLVETNSAAPNNCGTPAVSGDPTLDPLVNNGGSTQTMALRLGSPALNAGDDATCLPTDQRGVTRPQDLHCDIGAYEHTNPRPTVVKTADAYGYGSLNQAINDAQPGDTITFESTLAGASIYLRDKNITKNLTIDASNLSAPVTLGTEGDSRFFQVPAGIRLELKNLVLEDGYYNGLGGAIYNQGTLVLTHVVISNNHAFSWGGGVFNTGELIVVDSTFSDNTSDLAEGGAIASWDAGTVTIENSTFNNNGAYAIYSQLALTITNSTFTRNGGAGVVSYGLLDIKNSTFAYNYGHGIEAHANYSTGPNTGILRMENTILANNSSEDCYSASAIVQSFVNNLVRTQRGLCGTPVISADPHLGPLTDNGGPTWTMKLLPGSPAMDAGSDTNCPTTDQRGVTRPQDGNNDGNAACDIGAYEVEDVTPPTINSIVRADRNPTSASSVHFTVVFSEPVTDVDADDFSLNISGAVAEVAIANVTGFDETYTITVVTGGGDGTLGLNLVDTTDITDLAHNPLTRLPFTNEQYTLDKTPPMVISIKRDSATRSFANPTSASVVQFTVTFSEPVSSVDAADFRLVLSGVTGAKIKSVSGSGNIRTVLVNTGIGSGTLGLNLVDNNSITDYANNPLGGPSIGDGSCAGQKYTIIR